MVDMFRRRSEGHRPRAGQREALSDRPLEQPHAERLPADHPLRAQILRLHAESMAAGQPGYLDPATGLFVINAAEHARRGRCCGSGCRHCPFI